MHILVYLMCGASPVVGVHRAVSRRRRRGWAQLATVRSETPPIVLAVVALVWGNRNFVEVRMVRARREMSLVVVSRFFGFAIQMNFPGWVFSHQSPPERAGG
jgi:hypothetical protein